MMYYHGFVFFINLFLEYTYMHAHTNHPTLLPSALPPLIPISPPPTSIHFCFDSAL